MAEIAPPTAEEIKRATERATQLADFMAQSFKDSDEDPEDVGMACLILVNQVLMASKIQKLRGGA